MVWKVPLVTSDYIIGLYEEDPLLNCYLCKLVLGKPAMPPPTPALPDYRLHCIFPFQTIDIDYAGPVYVRDA